MIETVWGEQPPGFYSLSLKSESGTWQDKFFEDIESAVEWLSRRKKGDIYFCPTTLSEGKRVKDAVQKSHYLWQDLDTVKPEDLGRLKPTIAWESSPGRYQALWRLDDLHDPRKIEALNRALAYKVGADRGSWILTKVLRVPGTRNYKYPEHPKVKLLWANGRTFNASKLETELGPTETATILPASADMPQLDYKEVYERHRDNLPRKVRRLLEAEKAPPGKRSEILWYLENELIKAGLKLEEVYTLVKASAWNKYRGRSDEHRRLMGEIGKVTSGSESQQVVDLRPAEKEGALLSLSIQNDMELMTDLYQYPGWMVEGFWTRKSHGIIAGEPKSFKSTLVLDMAISIASGKKFLGEFDVVDVGPVLIVQNENAAWIMKDRLIKIRSHKGLVGEINQRGNIYEIQFPAQLPLYYMNQQGFNFNEPFHRKVLDKAMATINPRLVIFDPLYLMFDGDVSNSKDLNPVLNWLLSLKDRHDCSLVVVHHWRKSNQGEKVRGGQRMLGSTTLHGWIESAWYLDIKKADESEEIYNEEFNSPSASTSLVLEREFRGAGKYPKLDIAMQMGEFGSPDYSVNIKRHKPARTTIDEKEVKKEIKHLMELRKGKATAREVARELGISRKTISRLMKEMESENDR